MIRFLASVSFAVCALAAPVPVRTITAFLNVTPANAEARLTEAAACS